MSCLHSIKIERFWAGRNVPNTFNQLFHQARIHCLSVTALYSGVQVKNLRSCNKEVLQKLKEAEESKEKTYQVGQRHHEASRTSRCKQNLVLPSCIPGGPVLRDWHYNLCIMFFKDCN